MLCDTGPLVAIIDRDDPYHDLAQQTIGQLIAERLKSTWPCMTEAMHLLGKLGGHQSQDRLLQYAEARFVAIQSLDPQSVPRIRTLMAKYDDAPMDFAALRSLSPLN